MEEMSYIENVNEYRKTHKNCNYCKFKTLDRYNQFEKICLAKSCKIIHTVFQATFCKCYSPILVTELKNGTLKIKEGL